MALKVVDTPIPPEEMKTEVLERFDVTFVYDTGYECTHRTRYLQEADILELIRLANTDIDKFLEYNLGTKWHMFGQSNVQFTTLMPRKDRLLFIRIGPVEEHGKVVPADGAESSRPDGESNTS